MVGFSYKMFQMARIMNMFCSKAVYCSHNGNDSYYEAWSVIFGALLTFNKSRAVGIFHKTVFCRQKVAFCQNVERHISQAFYLENNKDNQ